MSASDHVLPPLGNKMPDGVILGARGSNGQIRREEPDQRLVRGGLGRRRIRTSFRCSRTTAWRKALLGLKTAVEKAMAANGGKKPTSEELAAAMAASNGMRRPAISSLALGDGHQAIQSNAAGRIEVGCRTPRWCGSIDIERFAAECVNPPPGIKSVDWIAQGFPAPSATERLTAQALTSPNAVARRRPLRGLRDEREARGSDPDRRPDRRVLAVHRGGRADARLRRAQDSQLRPWQPLRRRRLCRGELRSAGTTAANSAPAFLGYRRDARLGARGRR